MSLHANDFSNFLKKSQYSVQIARNFASKLIDSKL